MKSSANELGAEEYEFNGNVKIILEEGKVRLWVCSNETGSCMFRFISLGEIINGKSDIMVRGETKVSKSIEEKEEKKKKT